MSAFNKLGIRKVFGDVSEQKAVQPGVKIEMSCGVPTWKKQTSGPSTSRKLVFIIFKSSVKETL